MHLAPFPPRPTFALFCVICYALSSERPTQIFEWKACERREIEGRIGQSKLASRGMNNFLLLVGFHHERGNEVEWSYPIANPFAKDIERLYVSLSGVALAFRVFCLLLLMGITFPALFTILTWLV